jgi:hypothetical protein
MPRTAIVSSPADCCCALLWCSLCVQHVRATWPVDSAAIPHAILRRVSTCAAASHRLQPAPLMVSLTADTRRVPLRCKDRYLMGASMAADGLLLSGDRPAPPSVQERADACIPRARAPRIHLVRACVTHLLRPHGRSLLMPTHLTVQDAIEDHAHDVPRGGAHAKGPTSKAQGAAENGDQTRTLSHSPAAHTYVNSRVMSACECGRARHRRASRLAGRAWRIEYALPWPHGRTAGRMAGVVTSRSRCPLHG